MMTWSEDSRGWKAIHCPRTETAVAGRYREINRSRGVTLTGLQEGLRSHDINSISTVKTDVWLRTGARNGRGSTAATGRPS